MRCYHPVSCYKAPGGGISFSLRAGYTDLPMEVPCGRCIGCRLERARQWAVRCMHEAAGHRDNAFLTLTYAEAPLGLVPRDLQLFWKKLRRSLRGKRISYFACGEYGEENGRPHYHACVFGYWPGDAVLFRGGDHPLYKSAQLDKLWGHGYVAVGSVTFESANYVAGYIAKKITGPEAPGYYQAVDQDTGEVVPIEPEFCRSSRRPALGRRWLEKFGESDAWRHDQVIARGSPGRVPRYYDRVLQEANAARARRIKVKRIERGNNAEARRNGTPERLAAAETVTYSKLSLRRKKL